METAESIFEALPASTWDDFLPNATEEDANDWAHEKARIILTERGIHWKDFDDYIQLVVYLESEHDKPMSHTVECPLCHTLNYLPLDQSAITDCTFCHYPDEMRGDLDCEDDD